MSDESTDPRVGTVLQGRYRILARLAVGAMGTVYRAERLKLGRVVAIKFLHESIASDPHFTKRFEREALAMSQLSHPHCASVIDFGLDDAPYIVMDFVAGRTLLDLLDLGRLPVGRALHVGRQMLAGLAHAHGHGIIHRDIKPANVILTEATGTGDHVRILDFGLATLRSRSGDLSQSQVIVGTPSYMSPEQSLGEKVDARSDVYSTAVLLYQLLTGEKPFESDETFEVLRMHREQPAPSLRDNAPEVKFSKQLEAVIARALAKDPDDRYQSAIEFATALEQVPEASTGGAVRSKTAFAPTVQTEAVSPPATRRRGRGWLAMLVLLALGGAAAAAWTLLPRFAGTESSSEPAPVAAAEPDPTATAVEAPLTMDPEVFDSADVAPAIAAFDAGSVGATPDATTDATTDATPDATIDADIDAGFDEEEAERDPPLPPDELDEPVEPIPEDAEEGQALPEPEPAPAPEPVVVNTIADAKALIEQGRREQAIAGLRKLQRKYPKNAYVPYLLGSLYFEKMWWSVGLDSYRLAIRNNRSYRRRAVMIRNAIRALGSDSSRPKAAALLRRDIGRPALPYLRRAARSDDNARVRRWSGWLVDKLTARNKRKRRRR